MKSDPENILITGASSGIGKALAIHYARKGAFLALAGRDEKRLKETAEECRMKGAEVSGSVLDITDQPAVYNWIQAIDSEHPLDLVIANAGISGGTNGQPEGESVAQARKIFDVNLHGVLNTIEPVLQNMLVRGTGQIAIISSLAAYRGWPGAPAYSASKGAVRFYGEALRGALWHTGVRVNVVCPGFIRSRMTDVNDFPMPFLMEADRASKIIANNLRKNKGRISFPWPTLFFAWLLSIFPDALTQHIIRKFPAKSA